MTGRSDMTHNAIRRMGRTRGWIGRDELDLLAEAREITFDVAAAALVGFRTGPEVDWLRERFYALLHGPNFRDEAWEQVVQHQLRVQDELRLRLLELIAARRQAPSAGQSQDVLGMLVAARDEHGQTLSDEQLLAHVNILLVAGHETTTTLGGWLLYLLGAEPGVGERVDAELAAVLGDRDAPLTSEAVRSRANELGVTYYLLKPADPASLRRLLRLVPSVRTDA